MLRSGAARTRTPARRAALGTIYEPDDLAAPGPFDAPREIVALFALFGVLLFVLASFEFRSYCSGYAISSSRRAIMPGQRMEALFSQYGCEELAR